MSTEAIAALLAAGVAAPQLARQITRARAPRLKSKLGLDVQLGGLGGNVLDAGLGGSAGPGGLSGAICAELELTPEQCTDVLAALQGSREAMERLGEQGIARFCSEATKDQEDNAAIWGEACKLFGKLWLGGFIDLLQGNLGVPTYKAPYSPFGDADRYTGRFWTRSNLLLAGDNASDESAAREAMKLAERTWPDALGFCWYPVPSGLARRIRGDSPALVWPCATWVWKSKGFKSPRLVDEKPAYYPAGATRFITGNTPRAGQKTGQLAWSVAKQKFVKTPGNDSTLSILLKPGHHLVS